MLLYHHPCGLSNLVVWTNATLAVSIAVHVVHLGVLNSFGWLLGFFKGLLILTRLLFGQSLGFNRSVEIGGLDCNRMLDLSRTLLLDGLLTDQGAEELATSN